jgi:alkylation response protein AidB-like acyl-CoA dehydrogenase
VELEFTPDQEELRSAVQSVLTRECGMDLVRAVVEKGTAPDELWAHMVELGWPALTIASEAGGLGLGMVELAVVVEELGRAVAPGPFLPTVTQFTPAIREVGSVSQQERFLGAVAAGEITGAFALAEAGGSYDPAHVTATASPTVDDVVLHGTKEAVMGAPTADEIVVVARTPGSEGDAGISAVVVPRPALSLQPIDSLDPTRSLARITLDGVRVTPDRMLDGAGGATAAGLRRAVEEATAALAIETVGTCQSIFDITLDYVKQREQFGVPVGSFQAVKHKFADMLIALERARATAYFAALTITEDDERRALAVASAKATAGDCARLLAKEGIQLHGGVGYTWEHDMHLYVRRVRADAALFGTAAFHRQRVAELIGL